MDFRVHEAPAVPCARCGAPLAVDPTAAHVWCWSCHVWQAVPAEVRRAAWDKMQALAAAQNERQRQEAARRIADDKARKDKRSARTLIIVLLAMFVIPSLGSAAMYAVYAVVAAFDALEPWAAGLLVLGSSAVGLSFLAAFGGAGVWLYRRMTRHRRWARMRTDPEWYGRGADQALARAPVVCGECGAPIAFAAGEHSVACGFCRAVVLEPREHANALLSLALSEVQWAKMEAAKAERRAFVAALASKRSMLMLRTYMFVGTTALFAVPVLAAGYAWRALTPSLEEALLALARRLEGEFGAGLGPPFDWLDTYWIGTTPPSLEEQGMLSSRWSIAGVFHGRPVLISVLASWSDLKAERVAILLARPKARDASRLQRTPTAARLGALGWQVHADYAGVALLARGLRQDALSVERVTELARAAYELAEER